MPHEQDLDLTKDEVGLTPTDPPTLEIKPVPVAVTRSQYDAEKARDDIRGRMALLLIRLLIFIVVAAFVSIWLPVLIAWKKGGYIEIATPLKDMLQLLLAPVVGLVGAATGYYFGVSSQRPPAPSK